MGRVYKNQRKNHQGKKLLYNIICSWLTIFQGVLQNYSHWSEQQQEIDRDLRATQKINFIWNNSYQAIILTLQTCSALYE